MTRVKRGVTTRKRHRRKLKETKGFRGLRSKIFTQANIAWMKAGVNAYTGRKNKKRDFRALWISRISAGLKELNSQVTGKLGGDKNGFKYSRFIAAAKANKMTLDRKVLADMALNHPEIFKAVVMKVMA
jgi:large subunit ribosomal protein L20